jgi:hypothetical protein
MDIVEKLQMKKLILYGLNEVGYVGIHIKEGKLEYMSTLKNILINLLLIKGSRIVVNDGMKPRKPCFITERLLKHSQNCYELH